MLQMLTTPFGICPKNTVPLKSRYVGKELTEECWFTVDAQCRVKWHTWCSGAVCKPTYRITSSMQVHGTSAWACASKKDLKIVLHVMYLGVYTESERYFGT